MADDISLQSRVVQLEECVAHQDRLLEHLNDVILELRTQSERSRVTLQREIERLETLIETRQGESYPDEKPPHY